MKKFFALFLIFALSLTLLAACQDGGKDTSSSSAEGEASTVSTDSDGEWKNANGQYVPKSEVRNLTDKTFSIIVRGSSAGTYQSEDFTTESTLYGDLLNEAVAERNNMVEQIYHVTLDVHKVDDINNAINLDISGSVGEYDAIMPVMRQLATLASQNSLVDLNSIEGFDVYAPWYDKNATDAFSIKNAVYFTTGDITILNKVNTPSILFNKEMITNYHLDNPYDLVKNKEWTFDKMVEMARAVASTSNSDAFQNTYGMLTAYGDPFEFYGCAGETIVIKDDDDLPISSLKTNNERAINIAKNVLEAYANGDDWLIFAQNSAAFPDTWVDSLRLFSEGHALFRPSVFSATTKLRKQSEIAFGILPHPFMDSTQDEYVSYCGTGETVGIAIPNSAKDVEFSAYMIDAYSAWAKNYITHAYYDVNLYQKDARDSESEEMLDIIFGNIVYDMGECFNFGGVKGVFSDLTSSRSTDIVSSLGSIEGQIDTAIQELRESFDR